MSKITVIGCGATGLAFAADMILSGHRVTVFEEPEHRRNLDEVKARGKIVKDGFCERGEADLPSLTTDIAVALDGAELVFVAAVANRHRALSELMAPHLREGQAVCFFNGNCGSIYLKRLLGSRDVPVGETMGAYTSVRYRGQGVVYYCMPVVDAPKALAAYPARDSRRLVEKLSACYSCACYPDVPQKNVLEAALNAPNVAIHLISSVVNIAAVERSSDFRLYRDGLSPAVLRLIAEVERERDRVFEKFGYSGVSNLGRISACMRYPEDPDPDLVGFYLTTEGPDAVTHRYYTEDAFAGNCLLLSMAEACGLEMPVMRAAVEIASAVNGVDYRREGITLAYLGLGGMSPDEINKRLYEGV